MCLQPLNVCMSYQGTLNLVVKLSADHDIEVQFWSDEMKEVFLNSKVKVLVNTIEDLEHDPKFDRLYLAYQVQPLPKHLLHH